ncbi:MAG: Acetyl-CoA:oxalate CoA-transferase [Alphaproteobacteria bacterium MarineAlpha4_Bin2]|nr:MAG: Acetyl-CoA:oxalate CoA-transferase [Alphaproteobacteria bacterium MarineAlpha4_Bin2]
MTPKGRDNHGILKGIRVLDLTQYLAGPHCTLLLSGMGAEVIRVDNPATGDTLSGAPVFYGKDGPTIQKRDDSDLGIAFLKRLRGKKSITLDLKSEEGHDLFLRLVKKSDVVVENFSFGTTKRLGIDWPSLHKYKQELIYCSITGYGSTGPDAKRRAYDLTTQAMSGLMSVTGQSGNSPTKAGTPLADTVSAGFAFAGILGALFHRERTGEGQFVDVSMTDVLFSLIFDEALDVYERLGMPFQQGNRIMRFSPFNAYPTKDGWVVIGVGHDAMWRELCKLIGRIELGDDADWGRMDWRVENNMKVDEVVSDWTRDHATATAVTTLEEAGIVASPVQNIDDLLSWPHLRARDMIDMLEHPELGPLTDLKAAGFPLKFGAAASSYGGAAAHCGAHNIEVLGDLLGLSKQEVADLSVRGVI